jgi:hypothetical protein
MRKTIAALAATLVLLMPVGSAPASPEYVAFSAYITSAYYFSFNRTLSVSAYASYRDSDCYPSYQCDRSVIAEFTLQKGFSSYGRIVGQRLAETGQYGSSMRVSFTIPCRFIPKYRSETYTLTMDAVAPDGGEKTARRTIFVRSCR